MSALPPEVVKVIEAREGRWTTHAAISRVELRVGWEDIEAVAQSSEGWKRETDEEGLAVDGWKDSATGRDRSDRQLYVTGKRVYYEQEDEELWLIVTIKKHREQKEQRAKPRSRR